MKAENNNLGKLFEALKASTGAWWFPFAIAFFSFVNTYTLFLSGPLSILFISGCIAKPRRRLGLALANAAGVTAGVASLVYLGTSSELFPKFDLQAWPNTRYAVEEHLTLGVISVAALPIILHPLVFFAMLADVNPVQLVACVFIGRVIKYVAMGQLAVSGSSYIKIFGSSAAEVMEAEKLKHS